MVETVSKLDLFRARALGTNVSAVSLLATDYLNHFNEALMLAELLPDMPDMIDEFEVWAPKHYKDHFRDSGIADRELAIEAYDVCPTEYRDPFDTTVLMLNKQLMLLQRELLKNQTALEAGEKNEFIAIKCGLIRKLIDRAGGIINGQIPEKIPDKPDVTVQEGKVERGLKEETVKPVAGATVEVSDGKVLDQSDIDALFD